MIPSKSLQCRFQIICIQRIHRMVKSDWICVEWGLRCCRSWGRRHRHQGRGWWKQGWWWPSPSIMETGWCCWVGSRWQWGWCACGGKANTSCQATPTPWLRGEVKFFVQNWFYHLSCAWIVREKWWIIPGSIVVARSQWLNWRRRWICHLLEILRRFKLNALQKLGLIFSNFPPRHRLLFFFFTSWRKEQLVHKLESRQENLWDKKTNIRKILVKKTSTHCSPST